MDNTISIPRIKKCGRDWAIDCPQAPCPRCLFGVASNNDKKDTKCMRYFKTQTAVQFVIDNRIRDAKERGFKLDEERRERKCQEIR